MEKVGQIVFTYATITSLLNLNSVVFRSNLLNFAGLVTTV